MIYIGNDKAYNYFFEKDRYFRLKSRKDGHVECHVIDDEGNYVDFDARKVVDKWCRIKFRGDVLDSYFLERYGHKINLMIHCNIPLEEIKSL